jgi:hypothetical protein
VRAARLLLVLPAVVALAACGGGDDAQPLTLEQRVLTAEDAPGSNPDPVETRQQTTDFDDFIAVLEEMAVDPDETMTEAFREAGFQAAIVDARFFADTHSGDVPHVFSSVIQLESEEGAQSAVDWLHEDAMKPCPGTCAVRISEFEVDGIGDARGVRRAQTPGDIEASGRPGDVPFESYALFFTDGPFAYTVDLSGSPGTVTEAQAEEIAGALHDRVQGAPPAGD